MSDQQPQANAEVNAPAASAADQKIAELTNTLQSMNQSFEQRLAQIQEVILQSQQRAPAPAQAAPEQLDPFNTPDYSEKLASKIEQNLDKRLEQRERATLERQTAVSELVNDYPELTNPQSDLTKEAAKIVSGLDQSLRNSGTGYKYAVREAAAKLALLPKAKRVAAPEDFSLSSANSPAPARKTKNGEVSQNTIALAQAMGMDINDKGLLQRLAEKSKRNFNKYE